MKGKRIFFRRREVWWIGASECGLAGEWQSVGRWWRGSVWVGKVECGSVGVGRQGGVVESCAREK